MFRILFKPSRGTSDKYSRNLIRSCNPYTKDSKTFYSKYDYAKDSGEYEMPKKAIDRKPQFYDHNVPVCQYHSESDILNSPIMHYYYYQLNDKGKLYPYSTTVDSYFPKIIEDEMLGIAFYDAYYGYKELFPEASNNEASVAAYNKVYGKGHMIYGINPW